MTNSVIILAACILLAGLLFYEKKEDLKGLLPTKTALSVLFVLCAAVQPRLEPAYFHWIFTGLVLCLVGDVLLALPQEKTFLFGLIAFLVGHLFYVGAFVHLTEPNRLTLIGAAVIIPASAGIYRWLRPHLGSMHFPVVFYIIVISSMLCGAWSVVGMGRLAAGGRALVFAGALIFYLSDLFVARDRFIKNTFVNRLIGLPLYYGGQFMIAFSVGFILPQQFS
jgi:uncharacterized membrane protein YhhN